MTQSGATERRIAVILRWGSRVAVALLAAGLLGALAAGGLEASPPLPWSRLARAPWTAAVLQCGLFALLLTPVARVAAAVFGFWSEGDVKHLGISAGVLALLLGGLLYGL